MIDFKLEKWMTNHNPKKEAFKIFLDISHLDNNHNYHDDPPITLLFTPNGLRYDWSTGDKELELLQNHEWKDDDIVYDAINTSKFHLILRIDGLPYLEYFPGSPVSARIVKEWLIAQTTDINKDREI